MTRVKGQAEFFSKAEHKYKTDRKSIIRSVSGHEQQKDKPAYMAAFCVKSCCVLSHTCL